MLNQTGPPASYRMPATDLLGGLDDIRNKAEQSEYANHWDFEHDLRQLVNSAHDAHLSLQLCSTVLFRFSNSIPLVSVSRDGLELPQIYSLGTSLLFILDAVADSIDDAQLLIEGVESVSPVVLIDGQKATNYLEQFTSTAPLHDPDAQ